MTQRMPRRTKSYVVTVSLMHRAPDPCAVPVMQRVQYECVSTGARGAKARAIRHFNDLGYTVWVDMLIVDVQEVSG